MTHAHKDVTSGRDGPRRDHRFHWLDDPERAYRFEEELLERAQRIERAPLAYAERADLHPGLRSCAHGAYIIFFTLSTEGVRIERILHGARDLGSLFNR